MIAILAVVTGVGSLLLALRPALLVPAVVAFLACVPRRARGLAGGQRAGGDRPASRRRRAVLRRHERGRDAPPRAVTRRCGGSRRRRRTWRSGSCSSFSSAGAAPGRTGEGSSSSTAAFAVLLAGLTRVRLTPARIALGIVGVLAVGLAIVGIDALLGGSSHVTDAVGGGPGTLFDDLDRRLRISWAGATSAGHTAFLCLLSLGGLAWLGIRGRRAAGDRRDARRDRRVAARQRHPSRRARLRRARLPGAHGLGGDALARARQRAH